jgi:hypothetical protein
MTAGHITTHDTIDEDASYMEIVRKLHTEERVHVGMRCGDFEFKDGQYPWRKSVVLMPRSLKFQLRTTSTDM